MIHSDWIDSCAMVCRRILPAEPVGVPVIVLLCLMLFMPHTASAAFQVKFLAEHAVDAPLHVAAADDGKFYATTRSGTAVILGSDGKVQSTIQGLDHSGSPALKKPAGIAIFGEIIYIADTSLDRVVMFSRNGAYLDSFGNNGSGPGNLKNPRGLTVYNGVIYVADYSNDRIQIFGPNGVFVQSVGDSGKGEALLRSPTDVAVDHRGRIYAVDADSRAVKIYQSNGEYLGKLDGLMKPNSLAMAEDGVFVSDQENGSIVKFSFNRERLFSFGSLGKGKAQFLELAGICADYQRNVYAADTEKGTVQVIATERGKGVEVTDWVAPPTSVRWIRSLGIPLKKLYWDQPRQRLYGIDDDAEALVIIKDDRVERTVKIADWNPVGVAIDNQGAVWVVDRGESRLVKLDREGRLLQKVGASGSHPGSFSRPRDLAITTEGMIYVADTGNDRIEMFNTDGVFLGVLGSGMSGLVISKPTALSLDGRGNLYVITDGSNPVLCLSPKGEVLRGFGGLTAGQGRLDSPIDLAVVGTELFILDAGAGDVKVYGLDGEYLRSFGAKGEGKGEFRKPASLVALDDTQVVISDYGNKRLQFLRTVYTPQPPRDIVADAGMRSVELTWKPEREPYLEKYRIFRSDGLANGLREPFREIAAVPGTTFRDTDVQPDITYYYRVGAVARFGNQTVAQKTIKAVPTKYRPVAPSGLKSQSQEWSVDLQWEPNRETFVDHYTIYREDDAEDAVPELVGRSKTPSYTERGLDSDTAYTFYVAAVSTDGVESDRSEIDVETLVATKPPLEIEVVEMSDIFSNTYKIYETEGIGRVRITNNTRDQIGSLKLSFALKEFMDFPSEIEVRNLDAREARIVPLRAVFNNKVLEVTEDTPVQTELKITYYENQKQRVFSKNHTINLFEKHRMMWVEKDRIATFVTSKDPLLVEFARSVVTQYGDMGSPLVYAGAVFDALGTMGMTYLQHPNNPYQITAGKTDFVDYVQYPRETLKRNSGVCTDLVVFYSAVLESLGIQTKILGVPGHLFSMFSLGSVSELGEDTMNGMLVIHDNHVWVPVELTLVGSAFLKAWEQGSTAYNDWKDRGIEITDLRKAWSRFKPATLPLAEWRAQVPKRSEIDKRYSQETARLHKISIKHVSNRHFKAVKANPFDVNAYLQLGIIFGEAGELDESKKYLEKAESLSNNNAIAKNNLGNLYFLRGQYKDARQAYEAAASLDQTDPYILVNLAICYLRMDMKEKAAESFQKAYALDREVARKYQGMALDLLGGI